MLRIVADITVLRWEVFRKNLPEREREFDLHRTTSELLHMIARKDFPSKLKTRFDQFTDISNSIPNSHQCI